MDFQFIIDDANENVVDFPRLPMIEDKPHPSAKYLLPPDPSTSIDINKRNRDREDSKRALFVLSEVVKASYSSKQLLKEDILGPENDINDNVYEFAYSMVRKMKLNNYYNESFLDEIEHHLIRVFKINTEKNKIIKDKVLNKKRNDIQLNLQNFEIKNLIEKSNFENPFCIVHLQSSPKQFYVVPFESSTIFPEANKTLQIQVRDSYNDAVIVEVWYTKKNHNATLEEILDVRKHYKKTKRKLFERSNYKYLGECSVLFKDILFDTTEFVSVLLKKLVDEKTNGESRGKICFISKFVYNTCPTDTTIYKYLLKKLIIYDITQNQSNQACWEDWSDAKNKTSKARAIIDFYVNHYKLDVDNEKLSRFMVYCQIHEKYPLSYTLFKDLPDILKKFDTPYYTDANKALFWQCASRLLHSCFCLICNIRSLSLDCAITEYQLKHVSEIIKELSQKFDGRLLLKSTKHFFLIDYGDGSITLSQACKSAIKRGGLNLLESLKKQHKINEGSKSVNKETLEDHTNVILGLVKDVEEGLTSWNKMLNEFFSGLNCSDIIYKLYAKHIVILSEKYVKDCGKDKVFKSFINIAEMEQFVKVLVKLYVYLLNFKDLGITICPQEFESLRISQCHRWFENSVEHYFQELYYDIYLNRMSVIVNTDYLMENYHSNPGNHVRLISTSAVDILCVCSVFVSSWNALEWPDFEYCTKMIMALNNYQFNAYSIYFDQLIEHAKEIANIKEEKNEISVSFEWYFVVNNMDYIINYLTGESQTKYILLIDNISKKTLYEAKLKDEAKVYEFANECSTFVQDKCDELKRKLDKLILDMMLTTKPEIERFFIDICKEIKTNVHKETEELLKSYLKNSLNLLTVKLHTNNFSTASGKLRDIVFVAFFNNVLKKRIESRHYYNKMLILFNYLERTLNEFNVDCSVTTVTKVKEVLLKSCLHSEQQINVYYKDRCQEQNDLTEQLHGSITVRAYFDETHLNIVIQNCMNLNPKDSRSKFVKMIEAWKQKFNMSICTRDFSSRNCRVFVQMSIHPQNVFKKSVVYKTEVSETGVNPIFDLNKVAKYCMREEEMKLKDGFVHFEVIHKNLHSTVFMAEAFLTFQKIREMTTTNQQINLILSRPRRNEMYYVLKRMKGEPNIKAFIKNITPKLEDQGINDPYLCKDYIRDIEARMTQEIDTKYFVPQLEKSTYAVLYVFCTRRTRTLSIEL